LRDIDLFKKFRNITIGITITTLNDTASLDFETNTIKSSSRIKVLKKLHTSGISTYAHIGPILPLFTDLPKIFVALSKIVNEVWLESLNTTGANWVGVENILKKKYPELLPEYKKIFFTKEKTQYLDELKKEVADLSKQYKIKTHFFTHGESL
jgi:DNA repair photolyase